MSENSVRLPDVFIDAKTMITDVLNQSSKLSEKTHRGFFSNLCDVTHHHIEEVEDEEGYSNLDLTLTYRKRAVAVAVGVGEEFKTLEVTRNLRVLTSMGDNQWTYRMIEKVWEGDYPSTVAVDTETREVFLFSIKMNRIELISFGRMDEKQYEIFSYEIDDREPFKIKLDEDAMFDYIDGAEGINHLQKNVVVEFNCGLPIKIKNDLEKVVI